MKATLPRFAALLLAPLVTRADLKEDFSDSSKFVEKWVPYGRLADGTWAQGLGKARPEWWTLDQGALRGQNFPDEKHPAGISRKENLPQAKLAETGARISWRSKVTETSRGTLRLFGISSGPHSQDATDNHVLARAASASKPTATKNPPDSRGSTTSPWHRCQSKTLKATDSCLQWRYTAPCQHPTSVTLPELSGLLWPNSSFLPAPANAYEIAGFPKRHCKALLPRSGAGILPAFCDGGGRWDACPPLSLISPPEKPASSRFQACRKPALVGGTGQRERWGASLFLAVEHHLGSNYTLARLTLLIAKGLDELAERGALDGLCSVNHAGESEGQSEKTMLYLQIKHYILTFENDQFDFERLAILCRQKKSAKTWNPGTVLEKWAKKGGSVGYPF